MTHHIFYLGDVRESLRGMEPQSVNTCVTSPPYWGLRDYGEDGQLGLEPTPEQYVANMVEVFREVKRVLRDDGTLWLNLGDSYIANKTGGLSSEPSKMTGGRATQSAATHRPDKKADGLKPKDLVGIPWRVAFALQADGWYLRSDIIWHKPNPMPESVTDRPTKAHEYIFLLSKSQRYYYDHEAVKEEAVNEGKIVQCGPNSRADVDRVPRESLKQDLVANRRYTGFNERWANKPVEGRNKRTVWTVATQPFAEAHFATFPPELIRPCILAGSPKGGIVLDPFGGSGTTTLVASEEGRDSVYIDLSKEYMDIALRRCGFVGGKLFDVNTHEIRRLGR